MVTDALEECPESNRTKERFLAEIRKLQPTINLLITSRHISVVERNFEKAARVEVRASDEDVRRYFEGRIKSFKVDPALEATIVKLIVENAKGMRAP
jgi:ankyrin repeat domain-containing protein 50